MAAKWQAEIFPALKLALTSKMMLSTNADIALEGIVLAEELAYKLSCKYRIHTYCQSVKSQQEKLEKAEVEPEAVRPSAEAGPAQDGTPEVASASDAAGTSESNDQAGEEVSNE